MTKDTKRSNLEIKKNDKQAAEVIIEKPAIKRTPVIKGTDVTFDVEITVKSVINELIQEIDNNFLKKEIKKKIEEEVRHTYEKALEKNVDIYRLSELLYRKHLKTWEKIEEKGKINLNKDSLKVNVEVELEDSKLNKTERVID